MEIKYDSDKLANTVGYLDSALSTGIDFTRTVLSGAKRENQLSNIERAKIDNILIRLRDIENELTELKRTKNMQLNALCK